jgi:putative glutamine amidotransferase
MFPMRPRIALPVPHSLKPEYVQRSLPEYEHAIQLAGGEPVRIALDQAPEAVARQLSTCDAVLLPGSPADIDPQKYDAPRDPHSAQPDPRRDMVDELLLQDAYNMHKPLFGICYGLQSLNVWRTGTLRQHIEGTGIEHEAGREVRNAHTVRVTASSLLASILANPRADEAALDALHNLWAAGRRLHAEGTAEADAGAALEAEVNSSHHQAAEVLGDGLRVVARSPDGVIEAIESASPEQFILAVQWHPERNVEENEGSLALFRALVHAARRWRERQEERQ